MQMHYHWRQTAAKNGTWLLLIAHIKQKSSVTLTMVDQSNTWAVYIPPSETCEPKRCSVMKQVERKSFQEQQPNKFHY